MTWRVDTVFVKPKTLYPPLFPRYNPTTDTVSVKPSRVGKEVEILNKITERASVFFDAMPTEGQKVIGLYGSEKPVKRFSKTSIAPNREKKALCDETSGSCDNERIDWKNTIMHTPDVLGLVSLKAEDVLKV